MLARAALIGFVLSPLCLAQGAVVINEFLYDNLGADAIEFVELYNRSGVSVDIGDWVLDSADPSGANTARTIPTGTVLAPGGRWTIGADAANPGNIDQVVGTTNLWENSNESLTLRDDTGAIIDTLVYEAVRGIWDPTLAEGPSGIQCQFVTPNSPNVYSLQRCPDGNDTDDNAADFVTLPFTPAAPNFSSSLLPFQSNFGDPVGNTLTEFTGSFVDPTIIDPTVAAGANPNAIPASPTGGNAVIFWDPTGGGDACYLRSKCVGDFLFRACVYIDGALAPANEGETWNIGRGTVGAFGHHTDPQGTFYASIGGTWRPGNTGIAACWQRSDSFNKLMLIDYDDGTGLTVLGEIDIVQGVNDGWQSLRLSIALGAASLAWGNEQVSGPATGADSGGIYVGYREFRADNSLTRPPTIDDMLLNATSAFCARFGDGCPAGTPLGMDGVLGSMPQIGNTFTMEVDSIPANSPLTFVLIGFYPQAPAINLTPLGMPGCSQYVQPISSEAFVSSGGSLPYNLGIPSQSSMVGLAFFAQAADIAPSANPMGIITSNGVQIRVGN